MKLKKSFSFSDKKQIWRLLISDSDKILIETRDTENKTVFFHYTDLKSGKIVFKDLQLEEKYWIGVEKIYDEKIIFHQYQKPNMPEHKKIIVYDIYQNKILWQNDDLLFLSIIGNKIYAYKKKFEGRDFYILDFLTGEIIKEIVNAEKEISEIIQNINMEDFSNYSYPNTYSNGDDRNISDIIKNETKNKGNVNNIDTLLYNDLLMINYHIKKENNLLDNVFAVYNIDKKKKLVSEYLNKNLNSFSPDSFFCYKNNLMILKNKTELDCYRLV
jgi:hypothetical protein